MDDFNRITDPTELKEFISQKRKKFAVKVFLVLQFVKKYPKTMNELGATWCGDGMNFISNSQILGNFLGLKSNSINTNFRDHGFKISQMSSQRIKDEFQLIDHKHWKLRCSPLFTTNSSIDDIEKIQCIDSLRLNSNLSDTPTKIEPSPSNDFIPPQTFDLLKGEELQLSNIIKTYFSTSFTKEYFLNALTHITTLWVSKINSQCSSAPLSQITNVLLGKDSTSETTQEILQLEANIEYLLPKVSDSSQINDIITFDLFFNYFLKYGDITDFSSTLREISYLDSNGLNPINFNTMFGTEAAFNSWFYPDQDKDAALKKIKEKPGESWIVYPSKASNKFTLLFKYETNIIHALHIIHDPVALNSQQRFHVLFSDDHREYRPTLHQLLSEVLKLDIQMNTTRQDYNSSQPEYVTADNIANRNTTTKPDPFEITPFDIPSDIASQDSQHLFQNSQLDNSRFEFFSSQLTCSQIDQEY